MLVLPGEALEASRRRRRRCRRRRAGGRLALALAAPPPPGAHHHAAALLPGELSTPYPEDEPPIAAAAASCCCCRRRRGRRRHSSRSSCPPPPPPPPLPPSSSSSSTAAAAAARAGPAVARIMWLYWLLGYPSWEFCRGSMLLGAPAAAEAEASAPSRGFVVRHVDQSEGPARATGAAASWGQRCHSTQTRDGGRAATCRPRARRPAAAAAARPGPLLEPAACRFPHLGRRVVLVARLAQQRLARARLGCPRRHRPGASMLRLLHVGTG